MIIEITDSNFKQFAEDKLVVLFTSPWCSGCRKVEPFMASFAVKYGGIKFGSLDISLNPQTPARLGILSLPSIVAFKNGTEFERITGEPTKHELENLIRDMA
jgi:thioredoxin 1